MTDIKRDKSSIAWFVIAVLVENLQKNNNPPQKKHCEDATFALSTL